VWEFDVGDYLTPYQLRTGYQAASAQPNPYDAGSSQWWLYRLSARLDARLPALRTLDSYYTGQNDTFRLASQAAVSSGIAGLFRGINANLAKLVVDAPRHRLEVWGFRTGDDADDELLWETWQANDMDSEADAAHKEALVMRSCPVIVEPPSTQGGLPVITPQDPRGCIVEHAAGDRRVARAALKRWQDDDGRMLLTLYLPDRIERWQERNVSRWEQTMVPLFLGRDPQRWETRPDADGVYLLQNTLGEVPVVELPNQGRTNHRREAEHEAVIPLLDLYNKTLLDMATTSEFGAFPQRWGIGIDVDEGEVPLSEEAQAAAARLAAAGTAAAQYRAAVDMMLTTPSPDAQFGQFPAAPLDGYIAELDQVRANVGTISFTPYHLLLNMPSSTPATGEALRAAEVGLVAKVRSDHHREKGAAWERVQRLVLRLAKDPAGAWTEAEVTAARRRVVETVWRNPETLSEAQHMDALSKAATLGVPQQALWEMLPASPAEIKRWRAMQQAQPAAPAPAGPPAPEPGPPAAPEPAAPPAPAPGG
jgi:hypothetical protein